MTTSDKLVFRLLRYAGAGGLSLIVYYGIYIGLIKGFGIGYIPASITAFFCYIGVNFTLQKYWTFRDWDKSRMLWQLRYHILIHFINQILNIVGLYILIEYAGIGEIFAQIILSAYFTIKVWLISNYWIFRR